jgi:hypothetical protein
MNGVDRLAEIFFRRNFITRYLRKNHFCVDQLDIQNFMFLRMYLLKGLPGILRRFGLMSSSGPSSRVGNNLWNRSSDSDL